MQKYILFGLFGGGKGLSDRCAGMTGESKRELRGADVAGELGVTAERSGRTEQERSAGRLVAGRKGQSTSKGPVVRPKVPLEQHVAVLLQNGGKGRRGLSTH